jgi:hypothetical protein
LTPGRVLPSAASVTVPLTCFWAEACPNESKKVIAIKTDNDKNFLLIAFDLIF